MTILKNTWTISTNYKFDNLIEKNLSDLIRKELKMQLDVNTVSPDSMTINFETKIFNLRPFHPEILLLSIGNDNGNIKLINNNGFIAVFISIKSNQGLISLYLIAFILFLIGIVYKVIDLFSIETLILIISPIIIMLPMILFGISILNTTIKRILKSRYKTSNKRIL